MSLQWISIILGVLAALGGAVGIARPSMVIRFFALFPRSVVPAWIFAALCCWMGAQEAYAMNMGFLSRYKVYIFLLAPLVFVASVTFLKELLAPRALGGFLLLLAVPVVTVAKLSGKPLFQIISALAYVWVVFGLILLMSPWWFRKFFSPFVESEGLLKVASGVKLVLGIGLIVLGFTLYA